jgi:hypothetical protein
MKPSYRSFLGVLSLSLCAVPAFAGAAYVPVAGQQVGNAQNQTRVRVIDEASAAKVFAEEEGTQIPAVSSRDLFAAGATTQLLALERSSKSFSSLGLLNAGSQPASCSADLFRSDGAVLGSARFAVEPLSHRQFADPLRTVFQQTAIAAVQASITCNQPFYPYAVTYQPAAGRASWHFPVRPEAEAVGSTGEGLESQALAAQALCGPARPGIPCFEQAGNFFTPVRGALTKRIVLPFANKVEYKKVRVQIDVTHGNWFAKRPDGIHNIFWLAQGTNPDRIGYVNVRGPKRNLVYAVHHIGAPKTIDGRRLTKVHPTHAGQTYHYDYTFDAASHRVEFVVRDSAGRQLVREIDNTTFTRRIFTRTYQYLIDFGLKDEAADAPTVGWKYANLKVEFFR